MGFKKLAFKNGILDRTTSRASSNFEDDLKRTHRRRGSLDPPESAWRGYVRAIESAKNEATIQMHVTLLLKNFLEEENPGYTRVIDQAFTALPDNLGFNNGLATPQPDMAEGLMAREFMPFPIDDQLGGFAVFIKDEKDSITLPHLAAEFVGPGKDMLQARIQSAYDGAALVYARNQALKYIGKPDPRGYSAITTFTSDGTSVCFFCTLRRSIRN